MSDYELLLDADMSRHATRFMRALADTKPAGTKVTRSYAGKSRVLVMYGPGAPARMPLLHAQRKVGGRVAMFDLGYWDRDRSMRVSIDAMHPSAEQLAQAPPGPGRRAFALRYDADPSGPILLVGIGKKSAWACGFAPQQWEKAKLAELRRRFPGAPIVWRPKGRVPVPFGGLPLRHGMPIEQALAGCSLVACRHSNVAVDACLAGVPVECEAGAAHALYRDGPAPGAEQRREFLRRLSWWNWDEPVGAWNWIERMTQ